MTTEAVQVAETASKREAKLKLAEGMAPDTKAQLEAIQKVVKLETDKIEELLRVLEQQ